LVSYSEKQTSSTMSTIPAIDIQATAVAVTPPAELPPEFKLVVKQTGIEPLTAQSLFDAYGPYFKEVNRLLEEAKAVDVTDATQVTMIKLARELRLKLAKQRVAADKAREQLKAESKRRGDAVQGFFNILKFMVEPVEEKLLAAEEFAERVEAKRKEDLRVKRSELLKPLGIDPQFYQLADMPEDAFQKLYTGSKSAFEAQVAAKQKAEEDRIAKEKAEAEERERVRLENDRLKKEAEEREAAAKIEAARVATEKAELERKAAEAQKAREAAEAQAKRDREDADKRHAEEIAKKEREAAERVERELAELRKRNEAIAAKERAEREEREKEAQKAREAEADKLKRKADSERAEAKAKADAAAAEFKRMAAEAEEAKRKADEAAAIAEKAKRAEADRVAAEQAKRAEEEARAKAAAAAPDKEKLISFAATVRGLHLPELSTVEGQALAATLSQQREKFAVWIEKQAATL
jgi:hypothetical protein